MNSQFLFYTEEGFTVSPLNEALDSLQILGFEQGESLEDALCALLLNNPWILENAFNIGRIQHRIVAS